MSRRSRRWRARGLIAALLLLAAATLLGGVARAQDHAIDHVALDSARSHATFGVKVMWLVTVHGRFGKVDGIVDVDRFSNFATVDARIDANAVEMSTQTYDELGQVGRVLRRRALSRISTSSPNRFRCSACAAAASCRAR